MSKAREHLRLCRAQGAAGTAGHLEGLVPALGQPGGPGHREVPGHRQVAQGTEQRGGPGDSLVAQGTDSFSKALAPSSVALELSLQCVPCNNYLLD